MVIGNIKVERTYQENIKSITIDSDVNFSFIASYNRTSHITAEYTSDTLSYSIHKSYINKKLKELNKIERKRGQYHCNKEGHKEIILHSPIKFTIAKLYYNEPTIRKYVYSERHMGNCTVERISPHKYKITMPDKKVNYYTYEKGQLIKVEVHRTAFNLIFRLV